MDDYLEQLGGIIHSLDENPHQFNMEKYEIWEIFAEWFRQLVTILRVFSTECEKLSKEDQQKYVEESLSKPMWGALIPRFPPDQTDTKDMMNLITELGMRISQLPKYPYLCQYGPSPNFQNWSIIVTEMADELDTFSRQCDRLARDPENREELLNEWKWDTISSGITRLSANSTNTTNWINLPPELRKMCIEPMGLRSRFKIRRMAQMEKQLVDYLHFELDEIAIGNSDIVSLDAYDSSESIFFCTLSLQPEIFFGSLTFLLKAMDFVDQISYTSHGHDIQIENANATQLIETFTECPPIGATQFKFEIHGDMSVPAYFLRTCEKSIRMIVVQNWTGQPLYESFTAIPQFLNAKEIEYSNPNNPDQDYGVLVEMIRHWMSTDAPVGSTFSYIGVFEESRRAVFGLFREHLTLERLEPSNYVTCFRMADRTKCITFEEMVDRTNTRRTKIQIKARTLWPPLVEDDPRECAIYSLLLVLPVEQWLL